MSEYVITSVDLDNGSAQLESGERIPVKNMLDIEGHLTGDPRSCRRVVAGPCSEGKWYAFMVEADEIPPDPAAEALRASAPDLYEALVGVVDIHDNETHDTWRMSHDQKARYREVWERARKALKKAVAGVPDREKGK